MKSSGYVLKPRTYRTSVMPPLALEDTSRFGNNGTFTNVTWYQIPSGLWTMSLNGATSLFEVPNHASLNPVAAFSVEMWYYPTSRIAWVSILNKYHGAGPTGWVLSWNDAADNRLYFTCYNTLGAAGWTIPLVCAFHTWHHIVAVFNGQVEMYLDSVAAGEFSAFAGTFAPAVLAPFHGGEQFGNYLAGYITPPNMYQHALSASEVYSHFQSGRRWFNV